MSDKTLSDGEKIFIKQGVQENIRNDGRTRLDYRLIELETDNLPNLNGSAMGETKVVAGVKAEISPPLPSSPNKGWIEVSVKSTPQANFEAEGQNLDDLASHAGDILTQLCNNNNHVDLSVLCIVPGEFVWGLRVDVMVIGYGGNFMDVVSIATKAALFNIKIQDMKKNIGSSKIEKSDNKDDSSNVEKSVNLNGSSDIEMNGDTESSPIEKNVDKDGPYTIEFSDDPPKPLPLNVTNLPCFLTFNIVGTEFVIDATIEEEVCSITNILLAVNPLNVVFMKEMGGPGSLHIDSISDIVEVGHDIGTKFQKQLNEILEVERTIPKKQKHLVY